ncbi:MAG: hypothetical protein WBX00_06215 [Isosphaeraceae bacterium]
MSDQSSWWQQESRHFLNDTLAFINASRSSDEAIGRCEELCKALNKTWNAFFQYRRRNGQLNATEQENDAKGERSDTQSFREFLLHGLSDQQTSEFCGKESVRRFAEFTPHIMNHDTLLRLRYDPFNIIEDVRKKASDEHRQLANAFARFSKAPGDLSLKEALLKKIAQLIYVVRSNIAHSEKTPQGPDLAKSERDRLVSEVTARVIEDVFDILFGWPSQRLAVYGTLTPDSANASQLEGLDGQWHEGAVTGIVEERDGFLVFHWTLKAKSIPVKVLSASKLDAQFDRLDRFEGPHYQRILVPILADGKISVCNIYEGRRRKRTT